jgi:hypothetical protein
VFQAYSTGEAEKSAAPASVIGFRPTRSAPRPPQEFDLHGRLGEESDDEADAALWNAERASVERQRRQQEIEGKVERERSGPEEQEHG